MPRRLILAVAMVAASALLRAQDPKPPAFDVAAIKPNRSGDQESANFVMSGGRYGSTNVTLRMLMKVAYGVHDSQIIGGPAWIDTERWDVTAKAEGYAMAPAFRDQARLMLRPLLADRFKLILRREQRELPVYALVVAKSSGEFGPQFRRNNGDDCTGPPALPLPAAAGVAESAIPLPCGADMFRPGHLAGRAMTLANIVVALSRLIDRGVVDHTGLTGKFDWDIQWIPEDLRVDARPPDGPSVFEAFRSQAGLRLESTRAPIDVLVIERAERPDSD